MTSSLCSSTVYSRIETHRPGHGLCIKILCMYWVLKLKLNGKRNDDMMTSLNSSLSKTKWNQKYVQRLAASLRHTAYHVKMYDFVFGRPAKSWIFIIYWVKFMSWTTLLTIFICICHCKINERMKERRRKKIIKE